MRPDIEYLPDDDVDDVLDQALRDLLTVCFTKPQDSVFKERRYFHELCPHRWVVRGNEGAIVAHVGVHEKRVESDGKTFPIGGIAEVCVHPAFRKRGYVRMMLRCVHEWLSQRRFTFAVLFGDPEVYGSSGYVQVGNLVHGGGKEGWTQVTGMIRELSGTPWPCVEVRLPGPKF